MESIWNVYLVQYYNIDRKIVILPVQENQAMKIIINVPNGMNPPSVCSDRMNEKEKSIG